MEKLGLALKVIQDGMCQNTPITIKTSVGEAAEVLDSLLNNHKRLLQRRMEIENRLESHPTSRSASLGDIPKTQSKEEKRKAPSPLKERIAKKGKGSLSPSYSEAIRSQALKEIGKWQLVEKKKKEKKKRRRRKKCRRHKEKKGRRRSVLRSPDRAMLAGCRRRTDSSMPRS